MTGSQAPLSLFADADAEPILFRKGCRDCERVFFDEAPDAPCPDCGKKHPERLGFLGDAELAQAVEAADLPEHVDETRLDAVTAREVLRNAGTEVPNVRP